MQTTAPDTVITGRKAAGSGAWKRITGWPIWRSGRLLGTVAIALLGPVVALALGAYIYLAGGRVVTTDNAYVKADKIVISPDISGRVKEVLVKADQLVKRGDILFRIDAEPFQIAAERAEARLAAVIQEAKALRAIYLQKVARQKLAEGDLAYHQQFYDRQQQLTERGVVSRSGMDAAEKNLRNARDQMGIVLQEMAEVRAKLGGEPKGPVEAQPVVREAKAQRDAAALDLRHTVVRAPAAGTVTNFELQAGEFVTLGKVVFSIVGSDNIWVQANFKETELTHVEVGQKARIHVDTYPDMDRVGVVTSISPATGAEFALLPPQNATGNWVKVVQRLPVRLQIEPLEGARPLRAGMSVVVGVDTGHIRHLPRWMTGWFGRAEAAR